MDVMSEVIRQLGDLQRRIAALERTELHLPAGTASAPGLTLGGDTDTGIYQSADDNLDFATGGVQRLNISSNGLLVGTVDVSEVRIGASTNVAGHEGVGLFHDGGTGYLTCVDEGVAWHNFIIGANQLQLGSGPNSAAVPLLTRVGDTNTGIFWGAADCLDISTGGTAALRIDSYNSVSSWRVSKGSALASGATWSNAVTLTPGAYLVSITSGNGVRHGTWIGVVTFFDSADRGVAELLDTGYDASFTVTIDNSGNLSIQNNGAAGQVENVYLKGLRLNSHSG